MFYYRKCSVLRRRSNMKLAVLFGMFLYIIYLLTVTLQRMDQYDDAKTRNHRAYPVIKPNNPVVKTFANEKVAKRDVDVDKKLRNSKLKNFVEPKTKKTPPLAIVIQNTQQIEKIEEKTTKSDVLIHPNINSWSNYQEIKQNGESS